MQVSSFSVSEELFVSLWDESAVYTSTAWGISLTSQKSRRLIYLLFLVHSRQLILFKNYLSWFITHLFQKENDSWKFRVCSSVFIQVPPQWSGFGVSHHRRLIHADPPQETEHGDTCMAESTSMGGSAREGLAVTAFLEISWALSVCETSVLSDTTAAVMI